MIQRETVFVLGAGASHPFGFPTGQGLRALICTDLRTGKLHVAMRRLGYEQAQVLQFCDEFEYSGLSSIDSFLALRPSLVDIGREVITAALLPFQNELNLYAASDGQNVLGQHRGYSNWYQYLYDRMKDGARETGRYLGKPYHLHYVQLRPFPR